MSAMLYSRWGGRALCAALVFALLVATSGFVQAITGAGTSCSKCGAWCYKYHAERWPPEGCKTTSGMPDTSCLSKACANWCDGCVPDDGSSTINCDTENCWESGVNIDGGTVCSNACYGGLCEDRIWPLSDRYCGQVQQGCTGENGSVPCSRCGCVQ